MATAFPKIELHRDDLGSLLLFPEDTSIIAVAADHALQSGEHPLLDLNDPGTIANFIEGWLKRK
jgi:molybdopterin-guanine dinucleotide biosynthesis protein